jgi:signal transduction histidine kinase
MHRLFRSTALRLALAYAGIFILSSLLLVGFLWWRTAGYLDREVDAVIVADTQAVADRLHDFGLAGAVQTIKERVGRAGDSHAIYLLTDPNLTPIAGNLDGWPLEIGRRPGWHQIQLAYDNRLHATRFLYVVLPAGFQLLVGRDVEDLMAIRSAILHGLGWSTAIALLLAAGGGLLLRRSMLRRVDAITLTTKAIMRGDLSSRLPARDSSDEFDRLAQTINLMLQQIEILIDGVRNASNAVAHDLRTPLSEVKGRLEALLRTRPSAEHTLAEIVVAVSDLDRVIDIFNALLRLAEIESGARLAGFRPFDLRQIAAEVVELYAPVAEEKEISLSLAETDDLEMVGDPFLLAQAIGNLVDNAIKYGRTGGSAKVTLEKRFDAVRITVEDDGPGIPASEKSLAAERFFRGSSSAATQGAGLGLSLVAAVLRLHGGTLTLSDGNPGLIATMSLPMGDPKGDPKGDIVATLPQTAII